MRSTHLLSALAALGLVLLSASSAWAAPPLMAPFPCGKKYRVSQGHNTGSHTGKGGWAWDFAIPTGHVVSAPADGTVTLTKGNSTRHGCSSAYANDANYVVVDFGDGTSALFLHLKANSLRVNQGQKVKAGDPIGEVGLSGWVCGAHLHFQVQKSCGSWWCQSVNASFKHHGDPGAGTYVTSKNCGGSNETTYYADSDGDGHGDPNRSKKASSKPSGYVENKDDCNDNCGSCHPGGSEMCDGKDNDCDGTVDNGVGMTFFRDSDGDGYGDPNEKKNMCGSPAGYVNNDGDCDDTDKTVHPGAEEVPDGVDNNCDGRIDETGSGKSDTGYHADSGYRPDTGNSSYTDAGGMGPSIGQPPTLENSGSSGGKGESDGGDIVSTQSGCGCSAGDTPKPSMTLVILGVLLAVARRRRR